MLTAAVVETPAPTLRRAQQLLAGLGALLVLVASGPHVHAAHPDDAHASTTSAAAGSTLSPDDRHHEEHSSPAKVEAHACAVCRSDTARLAVGSSPAALPPALALAAVDLRVDAHVPSSPDVELPPSRAPPTRPGPVPTA